MCGCCRLTSTSSGQSQMSTGRTCPPRYATWALCMRNRRSGFQSRQACLACTCAAAYSTRPDGKCPTRGEGSRRGRRPPTAHATCTRCASPRAQQRTWPRSTTRWSRRTCRRTAPRAACSSTQSTLGRSRSTRKLHVRCTCCSRSCSCTPHPKRRIASSAISTAAASCTWVPPTPSRSTAAPRAWSRTTLSCAATRRCCRCPGAAAYWTEAQGSWSIATWSAAHSQSACTSTKALPGQAGGAARPPAKRPARKSHRSMGIRRCSAP
mmetsp:Transcript_40791/g.121767  ORF Transcript_40791/g.121767 Transcript_40791/m.121767 type:complete len:266 (-) Transcript_40791:602-1399(-)